MTVGERNQERRRHPRARVCWPVIVEAGNRSLHAETTDVSSYGAKLRLDERLELGTQARLHLHPEDQRPLHVEALVWRADPDGLAFFFFEVYPGSTPETDLAVPA